MAIFTGGLLQFIAGMWEFPRGNVFGATGKFERPFKPLTFFLFLNTTIPIFKHSFLTRSYCFLTFSLLILAFASFGCFWMSYSAILIPGSGVIAAYSNPQELSNAIGLFLIVWFMFTAMLMYVYLLHLISYFLPWDFPPSHLTSHRHRN
jgi:hypothetical protein